MSSSFDQDTLVDVISIFKQRKREEAIRYRSRFRTFSWTYRQAYRNAHLLRSLLKREGVKPSEPVMLWGPNSPGWVWAYLGAILNGSPVVPIDMGSHPDFVRKVLKETEARILFTSGLNESLSEHVEERLLESLHFPDELSIEPIPPPDSPEPDDVAEIIYTSGTTGTPKGTLLTHKNLVANQRSLAECVAGKIEDEQHFLSLLPLSHAFEQTVGFWYPMRTGGTITYLETLKPSEIFAGFQQENVEMAAVVPRFLSLFRDAVLREAEQQNKKEKLNSLLQFAGEHLPVPLRRLLFRKIHREFGGRLKYFIAGGAKLEPELEQFWTNLGMLVFQGYGLTETAPVLTCNMPEARKIGSVGKPLPGVELRISDQQEVLARGDNVFPGYFKRPDLNEEVFTEDWFHTGDLGEIDEDGFLSLKGREKNVIVTPEGLNVYPEDIEEILKRFEEVRDVCVLDLNDRITAVYLTGDSEFDPDLITKEANEQLSEAQSIQDWKIWPEEDFPRTTTLKIRRMDVREKLEGREEDEEPEVVTASGDELKDLLAQVSDCSVDEIQETDQLGPDLGLSSIDRLELVTLIERKKFIDLDEEQMASSTSVKDLREIMQEGSMGQDESKFRRWTRTAFWTAVRVFGQLFFLKLVFKMFCHRIDVAGKENLQGLRGPCVFIPNHISHFDTPAMYEALPGSFSTRLAVATWEEYFEYGTEDFSVRAQKEFLWNFTTIFYNIFPVPQSKGFRKSLRYIGELLDDGWNVLFFPEGERTIDGTMHPFRRGIGMIAKEMKVPIVPVRIDGMEKILPRWASWPRQGTVTVRFGEPIVNFDDAPYSEIAAQLRESIMNMAGDEQREKERVPVTLYEKDDCPLCHETKQTIARYASGIPLDMETVPIESDQELFEQYKHSVPVIFVNNTLASKGKFNERRFKRLVRETRRKIKNQ